LRGWRQRRRLSQLELALEAGVSARHVSFVETGRSRPSAEMVLRLADELDVPFRERNRLMLAAGYAPVYRERPFDDPELEPVREALKLILAGHEPYPALVVDRAWNLVAGNRTVMALTADVAPALLEPPVNVLRVSLHPDGMASRIVNLSEWRAHLLERLGRQVAVTGDEALAVLLDEVSAYPVPGGDVPPAGVHGVPARGIVAPLRIRTGGQELSFFSTVTTFGTAFDVTVSELAIESFFPADPATAAAVREIAERLPPT
jgi:transcriptional regulator with XRE-family HTH domain